MTFQLPEPAQVVETRTGDPVYVMFKCQWSFGKLIQLSEMTKKPVGLMTYLHNIHSSVYAV